MKLKCITALIFFVMSKPLVMVVPGQPSQIPTTGSMVEMYGNLQGKPQAYQAEMTAFTEKVNQINREVFQLNFDGKIVVKNTAFVMGNAVFGLSEVERFDLPFASIQDAIDAITPGSLNWCIIVYPGSYFGDIIMSDELNMYFYGGVTVNGNIQLGNNTHLQFDCGATVVGDIIDAGVSVESVICGCLVHEGEITLTGAASVLSAHGDQMYQADIQGGSTFNCYFARIKAANGSAISGSGTSNINIYGLVAPPGPYLMAQLVGFSGNSLGIYNCDFNFVSGIGVSFSGTSCIIWKSKVLTGAGPPIEASAGVVEVFECRLESLNSFCVYLNTTKAILRRNYITVANSTNVNQDAITISPTVLLVLEGNAIIAKGAGFSVISTAPAVIKSLIGNGSNSAVDGATVTESVSTIFVDANYE